MRDLDLKSLSPVGVLGNELVLEFFTHIHVPRRDALNNDSPRWNPYVRRFCEHVDPARTVLPKHFRSRRGLRPYHGVYVRQANGQAGGEPTLALSL